MLKYVWKQLSQSRFTKGLVAVYYVIVYTLTTFYLISVTFEPEQYFTTDNWFLFVSLASVFLLPFAMKEMFNTAVLWERRVLNWIYMASVLLTGLGVLIWYLVPSNPHLEPATVLLGFSTAIIVFTREQDRKTQDEHADDLP